MFIDDTEYNFQSLIYIYIYIYVCVCVCVWACVYARACVCGGQKCKWLNNNTDLQMNHIYFFKLSESTLKNKSHKVFSCKKGLY